MKIETYKHAADHVALEFQAENAAESFQLESLGRVLKNSGVPISEFNSLWEGNPRMIVRVWLSAANNKS